jgi:hypothetical protein
MACLDCGIPLARGLTDTDSPVCPKCGGPSARWIDAHHTTGQIVDYLPLDDNLVRSVILHIKRLAEHPKRSHSQRKLAWPQVESQGPLWDRELDGSNQDAVSPDVRPKARAAVQDNSGPP